MRVININGHPLIQLIKNCPNLNEELKHKAIQDIAKMITNKDYFDKVAFELSHKYYVIRWAESDLGHGTWKQIKYILKITNVRDEWSIIYPSNSHIKILI